MSKSWKNNPLFRNYEVIVFEKEKSFVQKQKHHQIFTNFWNTKYPFQNIRNEMHCWIQSKKYVGNFFWTIYFDPGRSFPYFAAVRFICESGLHFTRSFVFQMAVSYSEYILIWDRRYFYDICHRLSASVRYQILKNFVISTTYSLCPASAEREASSSSGY